MNNEYFTEEKLQVTPKMKKLLNTQADWTKLLGILGILLYTFLAINAILHQQTINTGPGFSYSYKESPYSIGLKVLLFLILLGLSILSLIYGIKMQNALEHNKQLVFKKSIALLSIMITVQGILQITSFSLYILLLLGKSLS